MTRFYNLFLFLWFYSLATSEASSCTYYSQREGRTYDLNLLKTSSDYSFGVGNVFIWSPCGTTKTQPGLQSSAIEYVGLQWYSVGLVSNSQWSDTANGVKYTITSSTGGGLCTSRSAEITFQCKSLVTAAIGSVLGILDGALSCNLKINFSLDCDLLFGVSTLPLPTIPSTLNLPTLPSTIVDIPTQLPTLPPIISTILTTLPDVSTLLPTELPTLPTDLPTIDPITNIPTLPDISTSLPTLPNTPTDVPTLPDIPTDLPTTTYIPTTELPTLPTDLTTIIDITTDTSTFPSTVIDIPTTSSGLPTTTTTELPTVIPTELPTIPNTDVPTLPDVSTSLSTLPDTPTEVSSFPTEIPTIISTVPTDLPTLPNIPTQIPTIPVVSTDLPTELPTSPSLPTILPTLPSTLPTELPTLPNPSSHSSTSSSMTQTLSFSNPSVSPPVTKPLSLIDIKETISEMNGTLTPSQGESILSAISDSQSTQTSSDFFSAIELVASVVLKNQTDFQMKSSGISVSVKSIDAQEIFSISVKDQESIAQASFPLQTINSIEQSGAVFAILSTFQLNPFQNIDSETKLYSKVVSVALYDSSNNKVRVNNTEKPINISISYDSLPNEKETFVCLYWDEVNSKWGSDGCRAELGSNFVSCLCTHLTNFTLGTETFLASPNVIRQEEKSNSTTKILAIVLTVSISMIAIIIIGFFVIRKGQAKNKSRFDLELFGEELKQIEIKGGISLSELIGSGSSSTVYKGIYGMNTVAVKQPLKKHRLDREISIIQKLHHPHVVQFLGCYRPQQSTELCLVLEYMECGTLLDYCRKNELDEPNLLNIAFQISSAMRYINEVGFMHADLSARNILLRSTENNSFTAKIADFGMARRMNEVALLLPSKFAPRWTAPEVLEGGSKSCSFKMDSWSFGVLLYEIFERGSLPYGELDNSQVVRSVIKKGNSLHSKLWPIELNGIIEGCFQSDPEERWDFVKINNQTSKWGSFDDTPVYESVIFPSLEKKLKTTQTSSLTSVKYY